MSACSSPRTPTCSTIGKCRKILYARWPEAIKLIEFVCNSFVCVRMNAPSVREGWYIPGLAHAPRVPVWWLKVPASYLYRSVLAREGVIRFQPLIMQWVDDMLAYTRRRTHACAHIHARRTRTHMHAHTHRCKRTHARADAHTHARTSKQTSARANRRMLHTGADLTFVEVLFSGVLRKHSAKILCSI